jgi:predicted metal-dependent hydrolase/bacterioferritin-associated ferredoxin
MDPLICFCNSVSLAQIQGAIQNQGCTNLDQIYEKTSAGVGPCGGSCRGKILNLLKKTEASTQQWEMPLEVVQAISLFNRKYYWETHEVLEKIWLEEQGEVKLFYQGLIQAAAALYHVLNNNPKGVIKLAESAKEKLAPFTPYFRNQIATENILEALSHYLAESKEILGGSLHGFDFSKLPMIQIQDSGTEE